MALLAQDRQQLAKVIFSLTKRMTDRERRRELEALVNKLTHSNPLSPKDREILIAIVEGLLATPIPKIASGATAKDYLLVIPAIRRHLAKARLKARSRSIRKSFKEILPRL